MPVVRGEEIRVTEEDVTGTNRPLPQPVNQPSRAAIVERVAKFITTATEDEINVLNRVMDRRKQELGLASQQPQARFLDRALLYVYLHVTPFIIATLIVGVTAFLFVSAIVASRPFAFAREIFVWENCPPDCGIAGIFFWMIIGGVALLLTFVLSYILRDRLLKARK